MLDMNIQPVALDLSKMQVQDSKVQGTNFDQDESSFSSMLEKEQNLQQQEAQQAKSTDGNQNTTKIDSKSKETESKIDEERLLHSGKADTLQGNSNEVRQVPGIFVESNIQSQQFETKISFAQIEYLKTEPTELNANLLVLDISNVENEFFNLEEIKTLLKDDSNKIDFDEKLELLSKKTLNAKEAQFSDTDNLKEALNSKKNKEQLLEETPLTEAAPKTAAPKVLLATQDELNAQVAAQNLNETLEPKIEDKINIIDERTTANLQTSQKSVVSKENAKTGNFVKTVEYDGNGNASVSMNVGQNLNQVVDVNGNPKTNEFSALLSKEIQNSTQEIVQSGSMILKDNNAGTINLILKPESLGTVKIKLEISDNQITGKILVASKEAYDAFNQNLNVLKNAFIDSGFNAGGFDLAFTGSGMNGNFNGENNQHAASFSDEVNSKGKIYEDSIPEVIPESYVTKDSINLVA